MVNLKDSSSVIVYHEEGPESSIRAKRLRAQRFRATPVGIERLAA